MITTALKIVIVQVIYLGQPDSQYCIIFSLLVNRLRLIAENTGHIFKEVADLEL